MLRSPRFNGLTPKSARASSAAAGASRKADTKPEVLLRKALHKAGLRYRKNRKDLPGVPDIVFTTAHVVVFVDGDFWHGKNWTHLKQKLKQGHNANYWTKKIERNIARDREQNRRLRAMGWTVLRFWESDVYSNIPDVVHRIQISLVQKRADRTVCTSQVNCNSPKS